MDSTNFEKSRWNKATVKLCAVLGTVGIGAGAFAGSVNADIPGTQPEVDCPAGGDDYLRFYVRTDADTTLQAGAAFELRFPDGSLFIPGDLPEILPGTRYNLGSAGSPDRTRLEDGSLYVAGKVIKEGTDAGTTFEQSAPIDCVPGTSSTTSPNPGPTTTTTLPPQEIPPARSIDDACPPDGVPDPGFTDTPESNVHKRAINCMAWEFYGVAKGYSDNHSDKTFRPGDKVSRAQLATFAARLLALTDVYLPADLPDAFTDDNGNVHERNINWLAHLGIIRGLGDGTVAPDKPVKRDQMATYLAGVYNAVNRGELPQGNVNFADTEGNVHLANINKIAGAGITAGTGGGNYSPGLHTPRDQMASFLAREADLLVDENLIARP